MLLKVSFWNTQQLMEVKREMQPVVRRNKNKSNATDAYKAFGPQDNKQTVKLQVSCNFVRQPMLGPDSSDSAVALPHQASCLQFSMTAVLCCVSDPYQADRV